MSIVSFIKKTFRKTYRLGSDASKGAVKSVRRVGRYSRRTVRKSTNVIGITKRRRGRGKGRKSSRKSRSRKSQQ